MQVHAFDNNWNPSFYDWSLVYKQTIQTFLELWTQVTQSSSEDHFWLGCHGDGSVNMQTQ